MDVMAPPFGRILSFALKTARDGAMVEVGEARAIADGGLEGSVTPRPRRGVTFLSLLQWEQVTAELGTDLPWISRRANVLLDAPTLAPLIGQVIVIGPVRIQIHKETEPCKKMNRIHPGLWRSLIPQCRGGVYGQVLAGGVMRIGDEVRVI